MVVRYLEGEWRGRLLQLRLPLGELLDDNGGHHLKLIGREGLTLLQHGNHVGQSGGGTHPASAGNAADVANDAGGAGTAGSGSLLRPEGLGKYNAAIAVIASGVTIAAAAVLVLFAVLDLDLGRGRRRRTAADGEGRVGKARGAVDQTNGLGGLGPSDVAVGALALAAGVLDPLVLVSNFLGYMCAGLEVMSGVMGNGQW